MTPDQSEQAAVAYHDELTKAVLEIERLKAQLKAEQDAHESWQHQHLLDDGDQCLQIRQLGLRLTRMTDSRDAYQEAAAKLAVELNRLRVEPYAIEAGFSNGDDTYSVSIERYPPRRATHKDWKAHEKLLYLAQPAVQTSKQVLGNLDDLRAELEKIKDNETELPKPFFGMGRYLSIAGTRDAYTKGQLRDYGDKRAAHARKVALEALQLPIMKTEAMLEQRDAAIAAIKEVLK